MRVAPAGVDPNGPSGEPSLSANGRYLAFASEASNLGPRVGARGTSNVYLFDLLSAQVTLISGAGTAAVANGGSSSPSISADGRVVAFASSATNLTADAIASAGRHNRVYVRTGDGHLRLLSIGFGASSPDGDSSQPAISADGRYVAFTSSADNLVPGDDNAQPDVFVADLLLGTLRRVSLASGGGQAVGASYNPSISADGRFVSFTSSAANLVRGDRNRVPDVFVHDLVTGSTFRVSVSSRGREQNASVTAPFTQVSSLSGDAHYVVFDSDARNLVPGDRNGHTDVFRHSLLTGQTSLISQSSVGQQANNDSFAPSVSSDGRVTVFESFADNLAAPWSPSENVFAQDLVNATALTLDVTPDGGPRGPELDPQLLQRPAVSGDGQLVAFTSGADDLVPGDYNGTDDLFVRALAPPATSVVLAPPQHSADRRPLVEFAGGGPLASTGLCILDGRRRWLCPLGRPFRLAQLGPGTHLLKVFAGAPGTLFDPTGIRIVFTTS